MLITKQTLEFTAEKSLPTNYDKWGVTGNKLWFAMVNKPQSGVVSCVHGSSLTTYELLTSYYDPPSQKKAKSSRTCVAWNFLRHLWYTWLAGSTKETLNISPVRTNFFVWYAEEGCNSSVRFKTLRPRVHGIYISWHLRVQIIAAKWWFCWQRSGIISGNNRERQHDYIIFVSLILVKHDNFRLQAEAKPGPSEVPEEEEAPGSINCWMLGVWYFGKAQNISQLITEFSWCHIVFDIVWSTVSRLDLGTKLFGFPHDNLQPKSIGG